MSTTARAMMLVEPQQFSDTIVEALGAEDGGWLAVEATGLSGPTSRSGRARPATLSTRWYPATRWWVGSQFRAPTSPTPVGTRVVVEPRIRCGRCHRCQNEPRHLCQPETLQLLRDDRLGGTAGALGWARRAALPRPQRSLHPVTDDVPSEVATFVHPLASGHTWAVELPSLKPGEDVLILGPGPRGLACLIAAKAAGAGWVGIAGLSHDRDRLELARMLGADTIIDVEATDIAAELANDLGRRPDVVIDVTSDDPEAVFTALDLVRSGGRVILASTKGNRAFHFLSDVIVAKQLTLRGAVGATTVGYQWATNQLETDPRIDDLVSHQFPLSEPRRGRCRRLPGFSVAKS
jgi:threonine dehydrogenase-like Zn-dependent dehydrogenase